jgi:polyketide cyclase/dehydrase/lipid transport protein
MAIHWENTVTIDRPIDELWGVFLDFFNAPNLPGSSFSVRQTSPGPMGLGSTIRARRVILGFETVLIQTVTEWDPPNALTVTIGGRPFRSMTDRVTLETVPGGTRLTDSIDMELAPALKLLWPVIGPFQRRQRQKQSVALKAKLESRLP